MNKLFIYYSLTNNGDLVADYLKQRGFTIRKVETLEALPKNYFLRLIVGGFKALINYKDKLNNFDSNLEGYDEIFIGSPIWNNRLCTPINSVLQTLDLTNKKVSFILYSGSGKESKAMKQLTEKYNPSIINLKEPNTYKTELNKLANL